MSKSFPFPTTLHQVAANVAAGCGYGPSMKEFIDSLIRMLRSRGARVDDGMLPLPEESFRDEPTHLPVAVYRAHLAGMAEHLADLSGHQLPEWVEQDKYFLEAPVFSGGTAARERVIAETPSAFSRRLLFCGRPLIKLFSVLRRGMDEEAPRPPSP